MSAEIELDQVSISFGGFTAVKSANFKINGGEFFSILGPSGCGKTTLLRAISGFVQPSSGRVLIDGRDMTGVGPNKRPTALIFQNLALFPLMSVADNVSYGLKVRGVDKVERDKRAEALLQLVALPGQGGKRPSELSGGQRQRVAIARALAVEPKVLLLDEPLSALDLRLRQHMRTELRAIQKRVGITFIYITHDQGEALTMSDRIAVMNAGVIEQIGDGREIYDHPRTSFVASFVGENNGIAGQVADADATSAVVETAFGRLSGRRGEGVMQGEAGILYVRPEAFRVAAQGEGGTITAEIAGSAFEGDATHLYLRSPDGRPLTVTLGRHDDGKVRTEPGSKIALVYAPGDGVVLPAGAVAH